MAFIDDKTPKGLAEEIRKLNSLGENDVYAVVHSEEHYLRSGWEGYSNIYFSASVNVEDLELPEGFVLEGRQLVKRYPNGSAHVFPVVQ